jgi:predicted Zn-dependent peptidase
VLFVEAPDLPMVDVRIVFDAGSARDGDQPGLASMTADMLTEGAGGPGAPTPSPSASSPSAPSLAPPPIATWPMPACAA